jgi:hypothetical protein
MDLSTRSADWTNHRLRLATTDAIVIGEFKHLQPSNTSCNHKVTLDIV